MKLALFCSALQLLLQGVAACAADYHLLVLANASHVPQDVRDAAMFSVKHTQMLRGRRESMNRPAGGEGITPGLDDSTFDNEQNPQYAAQLQREKEALMAAQGTDVADPGYIEDNEAPEPTNVINKRAAYRKMLHDQELNKRQGPNNRPYVGVWSDNEDCNLSPPDVLVRSPYSSQAVDSDANLVFTSLDQTYDFFYLVFGRDSINGTHGSIFSTIHYCYRYSNAIWDGVQIFLGDGDGYAYTSRAYVRSNSIIAHEFTHGVIQYENQLQYNGMSGALNEHIADVFASMKIQYYNRQNVYQATWLIGEGLVVGGRALRDMANPGTAFNTAAAGPDRQPGNMANYYNGAEDNGGVHFNSGIPNRAFYLFCRAIGGNSWQRPGQIWYRVLLRSQGQFDYAGETFRSFAQKTINQAFFMYDLNTADALRQAWVAVGVI